MRMKGRAQGAPTAGALSMSSSLDPDRPASPVPSGEAGASGGEASLCGAILTGRAVPVDGATSSARRSLLARTLLALALALICCIAWPHPARAQDAAEAAVAPGAEEGSAVAEEAGIAVQGFKRYQKGAARPADGVDLGYRYPLPEGVNLVALVTEESVFIWVDPAAAAELGLDLADARAALAVEALVTALDEEGSRGGATIADAVGEKELRLTSAPEVVEGAYRYRFCVEAGGRRYASVQPAAAGAGAAPSAAAAAMGLDLASGALWCDGGVLVPASAVDPAAEPGPLERAGDFLAGVDLAPFWVSLKTSAAALAITFVLGLLAAWRTLGASSRLKGLLDSVFTIPMVLPPTVCGFLLLLLFGQATPVGRWLIAHGVSLVFTWPAAVISAVVVSFPLMYRTALGAFESLDAAVLDAARTLGWSEGRIFRTLMMPLAWPSIAAGTVLAFARAMGEFGCTLFFAGNYAGVTQTIPIAIYFEWMSGDTDVALFWVAVVIAFSFAVVLAINIYTARSQRYRARGGVPGAVRWHRRGRSAHPDADGPASSRPAAGAALGAWTAADHGGDVLRIDAEELRALIRASAPDAAARREGGA